MSGVPPPTGPITVGTATVGLNGRVTTVGAVDVDVGAAAGFVDEEHPATTATKASAITVEARVFTVGVLSCRSRRTLDHHWWNLAETLSDPASWSHEHTSR